MISPKQLDEFIITIPATINKNDRKVIRPKKEMLTASSNGIDLLRKLQLARISVNPLTDEITMAGGGEVILCINGIESTTAQIAAIPTEDILRIEYHDNPGVRYAGATGVIDYIISRHDSGGNMMFDSFGAFASGRYASIDHLASQYNRGRSVWNANVGFMGQQKNKWIRDYEETWHYPDGVIIRKETGLPVKVGGEGLESILNYNYMHPCGNILNMRCGFDFDETPNQEQGDRHAMLDTNDGENQAEIVEHTESRSIRPNVGIYYHHKLSETQSLTIDLNSSYLKSRMIHEYSEDGIGEYSRVDGKKYGLKFIGILEERVGSRVWGIGVTGSSSFIRNTYNLEERVNVAVNQSQTALVGEYSNRLGNWGVMGNLRAAYNHISIDKNSINRLYLLPSVNISYRPTTKWFLRYSASFDYAMPSAAELTAVEQPIQSGMIRRGNPHLKPVRILDQSLSVSLEHRLFSVDARVEYRNEHKPVMESVIFENGGFVRTYFNQRSFQRLIAGATLSLRPWQNHLSLTAEPILTRYFSRGIDYSHCHNIFRLGLSVDFNYGNWLVYGNIMSGPENRMYGEEIIEEKDMNQIMVGYKQGKWAIHLGVFNAFMQNYWMETRNLSALAPYTSKAHSGGSSSYLAVRFNLTMDFGRKGREVEIFNNEFDNDCGILTGTK